MLSVWGTAGGAYTNNYITVKTDKDVALDTTMAIGDVCKTLNVLEYEYLFVIGTIVSNVSERSTFAYFAGTKLYINNHSITGGDNAVTVIGKR